MSHSIPTRSLPFSDQARLSWHEYLNSTQNKNKSRPKLEKILIINRILNGHEDGIEVGKQLKYEAKVKYDLQEGRLRYRARTQEEFRFVVNDYDIFDLVVKTHINLAHAGGQKTFDEIDRDYYGITLSEVALLLKHCSTCAIKRSQHRTAPIKPILVNKLFERVQVDLIDMSARPDGSNKWICHMRDYFSKFSQAYPLQRKTSENVAKVVIYWISYLGIPHISQCDNGSEFKGSMLLPLRNYGIRVINGRAQHTQSQGLIEQANRVLKEKLASWMQDHQSTEWSIAIPEVILAMNSQKHSTTSKAPYEIVFGQRMHGERILYTERDEATLEEESVPIVEGNAENINIELCNDRASPVPSPQSLNINIDPQLLNIDIRQQQRSEVYASVRTATSKAREIMVAQDGRTNPLRTLSIGDLVSVKISNADRFAFDPKRLICRIHDIKQPGCFELLSEWGTLHGVFSFDQIERVESSIVFKVVDGPGIGSISLRSAARLTASTRIIQNIRLPPCPSDYEDTITLASPTATKQITVPEHPLDKYIQEFDNEENRVLMKAKDSGWPSLDWIKINTTEQALITRLETPFFEKVITEIIKDINNSLYFRPFLHRRNQPFRPGRNAIHEEVNRQINELPSGYYSQAHPNIGPIAMEAGHSLYLVQRMEELATPSQFYVSLLLEVIVPEILIEFIQEDMRLDRDDAILVLENTDAMIYGSYVVDSEENRARVQKYQAPGQVDEKELERLRKRKRTG